MNIVLNYFLLLPFLPFYFFLPLYNLLPFETITIEGAFIVGTAMHSSMNRGPKVDIKTSQIQSIKVVIWINVFFALIAKA